MADGGMWGGTLPGLAGGVGTGGGLVIGCAETGR